ncbi:MAG: O-antigen ligase family protein [Firmicutes bacterium]|nr:O-antigen ligase family protein [Bacillota bacterium]
MAKRRSAARRAPQPAAYGTPSKGAREAEGALGTAWGRVLPFAYMAVLIFSPELRGLYFPFQQMEIFALLIVLLFAWVTWRRLSLKEDAWQGWGRFEAAAAALVALYLASAAWAADPRAAVQTAILYGLSLAGLLFAARLDAPERVRLMWAAVAAGTLVAALGVGAAAGTVHGNGYVDGTRVLSALQYPNSTAAYLMTCLLVAYGLWTRQTAPRAWTSAVAAAAASVMLVVFVYTQSRGAWLVFPAGLLLLWASQPAGLRLRVVEAAMATLAAAAPAVVLFNRFFNPSTLSAPARPGVWLAVLAAVVLGAALGAVVPWLWRRSAGVRLALVAAVAFAGAAAAALYLRVHGLPSAIAQRASDISLSTFNAYSRVVYTQDALKIVRDHPVLGVGGGGWNAVYHAYQTFNYYTTQVHNDFAQVWVEVGTVGMLLYLGLWAAFLWAGARLWRADAASPGVPATAAALALGAHSAIDFNLSLGAINLLLWSLWGVVWAEARRAAAGGAGRSGAVARGVGAVAESGAARPEVAAARGEGARPRPRPRRYAARASRPSWGAAAAFHALCGLALLGTLILMLGYASGDAAAQALNRGDAQRARTLFQRAVAADPFQATYRMDLGQSLYLVGDADGDAGLKAQGMAAMARAVRMAPYDANLRTTYANYLLRAGDIAAGLQELRRALQLNPTEPRRYENLAAGLVSAAAAYVRAGRPEQARPLLDEVIALPQKLKAQHDAEPEAAQSQRTPDRTDALDGLAGRAYAMRGDWAQAATLLERGTHVAQQPAAGEATLWLGLVKQKTGAQDAQATLDRARQLLGGAYDQAVKETEPLLGAVK